MVNDNVCCISQMRMSGYQQQNRNVLRRCLKTASDSKGVTLGGR